MNEPAITLAVIVAVCAGLASVVSYAGSVAAALWQRWRSLGVGLLVAGLLGETVAAGAATPPPAIRITADDLVTGSMGRPPALTPVNPTGIHVVERGDTLWDIATGVLVAGGVDPHPVLIGQTWRAIYERNIDVVGSDPDLIYPGQQLVIPEEA